MEQFGLIGNPLVHSVSPAIHNLLGINNYKLFPLEENELPSFVEKDIKGFNVTIPYKEKIIPYLKEIKGAAKEIGAVNTVVRTKSGLIGYNTDADGMIYALKRAEISLKNKNVLILGTGGTSKTAAYVAEISGAKSITKVGRTSKINYNNVYSLTATEIIINTTPVGMYPITDAMPVDPKKFPALKGIFDCIYNPKETLLVNEGKKNGVNAANGIFMLIEQARKAEELFLNKSLSPSLIEKVFDNLKF